MPAGTAAVPTSAVCAASRSASGHATCSRPIVCPAQASAEFVHGRKNRRRSYERILRYPGGKASVLLCGKKSEEAVVLSLLCSAHVTKAGKGSSASKQAFWMRFSNIETSKPLYLKRCHSLLRSSCLLSGAADCYLAFVVRIIFDRPVLSIERGCNPEPLPQAFH